MHRGLFSLLIAGFASLAIADSAIQTDWSGGYGVSGPVVDWGNRFATSLSLDWGGLPGTLGLESQITNLIYGVFPGATSVRAGDMDGDGDIDVLGAATIANDITWWENTNGIGTSWNMHPVDTEFTNASSLHPVDLDGDGDMDVLAVGYHANTDITWWENTSGSGLNWTEHTVASGFGASFCVYSDDMDNDGDMDVLSTAFNANEIAWWENNDGTGMSWTEHTIASDFLGASSVYTEDVDGDGDMDVIGSAYYENDISWWENTDGSGTSLVEHRLNSDFACCISVYAADIEGDGDVDIMAASYLADDIAWWENDDGSGTSWTMHTVDASFDGAYCVHSEDMDDDGDMDILGAAQSDDDIVWWENEDGTGTLWGKHIVGGNFNGARSVYTADVDGNGCPDILGAAVFDFDITWWNITPSGYLESSILDVQEAPEWDYIEWIALTPPGTAVAFQVRASDNYTAMGAWSDTLTASCLLDGILDDGDIYVQYRVMLTTARTDTTPALLNVMLTWDPMGIEGTEGPAALSLLPFYPNPSSAPVARLSIPEPALVEVRVFDLSGRIVLEIPGAEYASGYHGVLLGELSPGIYICRIVSGDVSETERFVAIE